MSFLPVLSIYQRRDLGCFRGLVADRRGNDCRLRLDICTRAKAGGTEIALSEGMRRIVEIAAAKAEIVSLRCVLSRYGLFWRVGNRRSRRHAAEVHLPDK